jgi:hypothetical protein
MLNIKGHTSYKFRHNKKKNNINDITPIKI